MSVYKINIITDYLVVHIQPVLSFQRGEVKICDYQSGSLKRTKQSGTATISNQRRGWLRASEADISPPSPRPGSAAEGTSFPDPLLWTSQEHLKGKTWFFCAQP